MKGHGGPGTWISNTAFWTIWALVVGLGVLVMASIITTIPVWLTCVGWVGVGVAGSSAWWWWQYNKLEDHAMIDYARSKTGLMKAALEARGITIEQAVADAAEQADAILRGEVTVDSEWEGEWERDRNQRQRYVRLTDGTYMTVEEWDKRGRSTS